MKKIISSIFVCGSMLLCLSSCNRDKYFVPLGSFSSDVIASLSESSNVSAKDYFSSKTMQSGELFKIIDSNASYYLNGKKLPFYSVATKAKFFVINIGLADVLPSMNINPSKNIVEFDNDLVDRQLEVFEYHLYHSLDMIRDINASSPILLLGSYNEYKFEEPERLLYATIISRINKTILSAGADHKTRYVSLLNIEERVDENYEANKAQLIAEIVKEYI